MKKIQLHYKYFVVYVQFTRLNCHNVFNKEENVHKQALFLLTERQLQDKCNLQDSIH